MSKITHKRPIALMVRIAGTAVSTLLFIVLISRQKWDVVFEKAAGVSLWAVAGILLIYWASFGFNTLRWSVLLWAQSVKISLWQAFRLTLAGNFASNFLPSTIGGDGFRMLAVHPYTGRKTISIGSVVLDRIINMTAMACLIPAPMIIFGTSLVSLLKGSVWNIAQHHVPGYWLGWRGASLSLISLPVRVQDLLEKYSPKLIAALKSWASKPWAFVFAFLAAWPSNLLPMTATYLLAHQLGMTVNFWQVLGVQTVTYFLSVLPISINGYGLREVAYTTLYAALGASVEQASTLALFTRFLTVLATIPGALWLSSVATSLSQLDDDPDLAQGNLKS